ncbi:MAG: MBL fold metallo-hydrolase [Alistipes senegalensis]|nr:MBL fold metallo-hydrolase [Oxalobacter formigenes]MCM1281852.1 MBL fold metallo-hydrolase [Alistipes senegalensis]
MKRLIFTLSLVLTFALTVNLNLAKAADNDLSLQHIRNATIKLASGDTTFLIDPMFAEVGAYEGFPDTYRSWLRNPLTPLPMPVKDILDGVDAVVLTHTHLDHWDKAAQEALPKDIPFYVQNGEDAKVVKNQGFTNVRIMKESDEFGKVKMERTATQHGSKTMYADPALGKALGEVMGVVFTTSGGKKAWLVGDTIWFEGVDEALSKHAPDVIIVNAGGASMSVEKFKDAPEIIMGKEDVWKMVTKMPKADVVAIHMDAINHMTVDRKDLSQYARKKGIRDKVLIPFDGETLKF